MLSRDGPWAASVPVGPTRRFGHRPAPIGRYGLLPPDQPPPTAAGLALAHQTLRDGAAFIGQSVRQSSYDNGDINLLGDMVEIRLLGNGLRELDRFLGLLIEEVADRIGSAEHDPRAFARLRNTANKLRLVRGMMELGSPDHRWLRAVGRLRVCLHHCGGEVRAPGHPAELSLAGCRFGEPERADSPRARLVLTSDALDRISHVYRRVGDDLVAELDRWAPGPA